MALTQERPEITLRGLPRRKKRRRNRQPLAAARGRTGEHNSRQPPQQDRWLPLREHWPCWRHGNTQPGQ